MISLLSVRSHLSNVFLERLLLLLRLFAISLGPLILSRIEPYSGSGWVLPSQIQLNLLRGGSGQRLQALLVYFQHDACVAVGHFAHFVLRRRA